ncbi:MAG: hypothetical protein ACFFDI_02670 [Promethearchaeota archaeon]
MEVTMMRKTSWTPIRIIFLLSILSAISFPLTEFFAVTALLDGDDDIRYRVSWWDYDDDMDGKVDRIDISTILEFNKDVYVLLDVWIHIKAFNSSSGDYSTVDFLWISDEIEGRTGCSNGYGSLWRPIFDGEFQFNVKFFVNSTLQFSDSFTWNGWKPSNLAENRELTWSESDKDSDGFMDTLDIFFIPPESPHNLTTPFSVEVTVTAKVFPLNESSPKIEDSIITLESSVNVENLNGSAFSVNITLHSPLEGDLIIKNTVRIGESDNSSFEIDLRSIYWENAHQYQNSGKYLHVTAQKIGENTESTTVEPPTGSTGPNPSYPSSFTILKPFDTVTTLFLGVMAGVIALGIILKFERLKRE